MSFQTYEEAVASLTNEQLSDEIFRKQNIQKRRRPDSEDWQRASKLLAVLFAEAATRHQRGEIVEDRDAYEQRVRQLEGEGLTRSDAQAVVDAQDI